MDNKSNIYYMTNNNHEKIKASLVIASYLDTLGFKNGQWEFNFNTSINNLKHANLIQNEIVHHFFALGGYQINISKWYASDDTILMIATKKACEKGGELKEIQSFRSQLKLSINDLEKIYSVLMFCRNFIFNQIDSEEYKNLIQRRDG